MVAVVVEEGEDIVEIVDRVAGGESQERGSE